MQVSQIIAAAALFAGSAVATPKPAASTPKPIEAPNGNFTDEMLKGHHFYRSQHSAKDLKWSTKLAGLAQKKINSCKFEHDDEPYGENLAYNSEKTWASFINQWGGERTQYDFNRPTGYSDDTGHFTQLVWKDTTSLGCGYTKCSYGVLVSCFYDPQGNIEGDNNKYFKDNVGKQVSGKATDKYVSSS
ncbi:hypothetical protein VHEMI02166 [[Torrubiella] hemipterigena]|uniref:SCP domain-containing protein n=1 Tax=[Torrubiella] hemipterigena TaxID=1531966 RepID=A0A0A1T7D7_9HYPO|nr:hypothetical protein VHEMI02166 [[Torrubiella] hemipterigena]